MVIDRFRDGGSLSAGGTFCRNGGRWKRRLVRLQFPAHGSMVVEVNAEPNFLLAAPASVSCRCPDSEILAGSQHLRVEIDLSHSNCRESTQKTKYVACLIYSP